MSKKLTCKMSDGREWEVMKMVNVGDGETSLDVVATLRPPTYEPREFKIEIDSITGNIIGCGYYTSTPGGAAKGREIIKVREVIK